MFLCISSNSIYFGIARNLCRKSVHVAVSQAHKVQILTTGEVAKIEIRVNANVVV
jgi:hypothetical protein